jgi:hypothetical protein
MKVSQKEDKFLKVYIKEYEKLTGKSFLQDSKKEPNFHDIYNRLEMYFEAEYKKNPDEVWCRKVLDKAHGETEKTMAMQNNTDILLIAVHFPIFMMVGSFINKLSIAYPLYILAYFVWILGFSLIRINMRTKKLYKADFKMLCVSIMERVLDKNVYRYKAK